MYYGAVAVVSVELAKIALICTISFTLLGLACAGFDVSRFYTTLLDFRENEESTGGGTTLQKQQQQNASPLMSHTLCLAHYLTETDQAVNEPEVELEVELEPKLRTVAFKDLSSEDTRECCVSCLFFFAQRMLCCSLL